jgi:chemotaxis protein histidine kinase CheA
VLERDGASAERIDRVFRAFHTLKGSAGVVELPAMSIMLHAAEDLLASVRQGMLDSSPDIIDAALACLDQVSRWVDDFEANEVLPAQAGEDGRMLAERMRSFLPARAGRQQLASAARKSTADIEAGLPEWAACLIAAERDAMLSRMPERASAMSAISYQPIPGCFYNGDDPLQFASAGHFRRRSRRNRQDLSAGAGSGANHRHSARCACRDTTGCERCRPNPGPGCYRSPVRTAAVFQQNGRFCRLHGRCGACRN